MKRFLAILMAALMLLSLCGVAAAEEEFTVGYMLHELAGEYTFKLLEAYETRCAELGYKLVGYDARMDPANDMTNAEDLINLGVDFILYTPVDSEGGVSVVEKINEAGIPVITVDRNCNGGDIVCNVASNNVGGGEIAAKYILEQLGEEGGAVAEIQGTAGASAATDRHTGFDNVMQAAENVTVVSSQIGDWDRTKGMTIMENILTSYPEVKGLFCACDSMALGALEACQAAGRDDIIIVGFDADTDGIVAIKDGLMAGSVKQQADLIGRTAVDTIQAYMNGETIDPIVSVDVLLITADNVDTAA